MVCDSSVVSAVHENAGTNLPIDVLNVQLVDIFLFPRFRLTCMAVPTRLSMCITVAIEFV